MEKFTVRKKLNIVRHFLSGLSYDEIASKTGASKGSVANVIAELKAGAFPEAADLGDQIELLRELSVELKGSRLSLGQCAVGLTVLDRIRECGLTPADFDRLPIIIKSAGSEEEAQEFLGLVNSIHEVMERTGLSIDGLNNKVLELEKRAAELEPIANELKDCRKQLGEMKKQRDQLAAYITGLKEKRDMLTPLVRDLEKREQDLIRRNKELEAEAEKAETALRTLKRDKKRLADIGLTLEKVAELSQESQAIARKYHVTSSELWSRLRKELKNLDEALGLEVMIGRLQAQLKGQKQTMALAQKEADSLKADIGDLKQEKAQLEAGIKHTREKMADEVAKIVPSARESIKQWQEELQTGHDEALLEVRRIRDEIIDVGKEIGRYEQMVQANQWLSNLYALVNGDDGIEAERIRGIVLPVLRGVTTWLERNQGHNARYMLPFAVKNLITEMEQWEA